ncbi:AAA family ATPase, partial [Bittarella massiliensis]|nr:AAA family ATPase [Bittarella massiliensis (ex Durand et al. 2017)]
MVYADTQREAIAQALRQGFVVLTGGHGTGKTTTINGMIELFE